jgi:choline dehydrogenase
VALFDRALALGLVLEGGRATGIRIRRGGAEQVVSARREVILSAGAIGSPHLLMLSGLGPAEHLRQHGSRCGGTSRASARTCRTTTSPG